MVVGSTTPDGGPAEDTPAATGRGALAGLDPVARRVLEMAHHDRLSVIEIAEVVDRPPRAVRLMLREALLLIARRVPAN